jgi:hypothetical protein
VNNSGATFFSDILVHTHPKCIQIVPLGEISKQRNVKKILQGLSQEPFHNFIFSWFLEEGLDTRFHHDIQLLVGDICKKKPSTSTRRPICSGKKAAAAPLTLTYVFSGLTHRAKLLGSVQGVVVQASRETSGSFTDGKLTMTAKQKLDCNKICKKIWKKKKVKESFKNSSNKKTDGLSCAKRHIFKGVSQPSFNDEISPFFLMNNERRKGLLSRDFPKKKGFFFLNYRRDR